jgi:hypothetical protein
MIDLSLKYSSLITENPTFIKSNISFKLNYITAQKKKSFKLHFKQQLNVYTYLHFYHYKMGIEGRKTIIIVKPGSMAWSVEFQHGKQLWKPLNYP